MTAEVYLTTYVDDELRQEFILRGSDGIAIDLTGATWAVLKQTGLTPAFTISTGASAGQFYLTGDMTDAEVGIWAVHVQVTWPALRPSPDTLLAIKLEVKGRPA